MATKNQKNNSFSDKIKDSELEDGHLYMLQIVKEDGYPLFCGVFDSQEDMIRETERLHNHIEDITSKAVEASIKGDEEALNELDKKYGAGEIVRDFKSIDVIVVPINHNIFPFEIPEDYGLEDTKYESDEELNEAFFQAVMNNIQNYKSDEAN